MKRSTALASIALCLPALCEPASVGKSFDEAWRATLQAMALEGIQVVSSDKDAGLIQGKGSFAGHGEWFGCSGGGGLLNAQEFTLSAVVSHDGNASTRVEFRADGKQMWLRHHHVLWMKVGREWTPISCSSTGVLEQRLLSRISSI